ncbi:tetraacyldisaccharide 4'-kinase [Herbaspirillum autotrophicum]|uniref:tetraacyldisaccharide 4'-kinase n=1 Tax=Herbaspirillum autotrophicum TaxID=180195 RepID=UPI00067D8E6C|nr:tetraacyldisaccharide 4'-kinase [Herbaspirillum autotrophicum]
MASNSAAVSAASLESTLTRAWMRRGWLACLLWPLSLLFGLLAALRRALFALGLKPVTRLPVPVIVAGNILVGGTGKTPLTIWLVEALREAGYRPGVISRGYGTADGAARPVTATSHAHEVGDEPLLIAERTGCPVMVGRNRVAAGQALLAAHPETDVIVSDDGLQHYALARDIEIVLSDARGAGNGWLLPAGPLREPVSRRRDFSVRNVGAGPALTAPGEVAMALVGDRAERLQDRSRTQLLSAWQGASRLVAVAGIGNPARFFATLEQAGLRFDRLPLPDHHDFADNPFAALAADIILITEKDAVKCKAIEAIKNDPRIWVVPVTARIDSALAEHIVEKLRERPTA